MTLTHSSAQLSSVGAGVSVLNNNVAKAVLRPTEMKNLGLLFASTTCVVHAKDVESLAAVLKIKQAKMGLLGGKIEDRLCSADEVEAIGALPSLDISRAQLVGLLSSPAQKLVGMLGQSPSDLVAALYVMIVRMPPCLHQGAVSMTHMASPLLHPPYTRKPVILLLFVFFY